MKDRAYIVTGGAGFVASHLILELLKQGHEVAIFDHAPRKSPFYDHPDVKIIDADTRTPGAVDKAIVDYDIVVHLAAHVDVRESIENPLEDADNNVMGAINVLEACRKHGKPVIYSSSAAVYGNRASLPLKESAQCNPASPYGLSKLCAERYFQLYYRLYGVKTVCLRILNIAGPLKFKGVFHNFAKALVNGEPITIHGDGENTRDFIPVGDVVSAITACTGLKVWGEVFNIGTSKPTTVNALLKLFKKFNGGDNNTYYKSAIKGEIKNSYADISKAREVLGWTPKLSLEEEVGRIMAWAKNGMDINSWRDMHGI